VSKEYYVSKRDTSKRQMSIICSKETQKRIQSVLLVQTKLMKRTNEYSMSKRDPGKRLRQIPLKMLHPQNPPNREISNSSGTKHQITPESQSSVICLKVTYVRGKLCRTSLKSDRRMSLFVTYVTFCVSRKSDIRLFRQKVTYVFLDKKWHTSVTYVTKKWHTSF